MKKIFSTLLGLTFALGFAQQKKHTVVSGENPTVIARKYGISVNELLSQNPKAKDGKLQIGDVLVIPNKAGQSKPATTKTPAGATSKKLGTIYVQPRETIYGITRQYKISEAELRRLNPNLAMRVGEAIVLPEENIRKYGNATAQKKVAETPKKEENKNKGTASNTNPDTYLVQPNDSYYAITRKFNISKEQLVALNPQLQNRGLQAGEVLKLKGNVPKTANNTATPKTTKVVSNPKTISNNGLSDEYVKHIVQKDDTIFGILNKYNITYEELAELNDGLANGLREGTELRIKRYEKQYVKASEGTFNITLMLPFGYDSNDSKYRSLATDFLVGAKMAAERNVAKGKKISINVIDAENENSFRNSLAQINKNNTNLIIGPFFKSNVLEVLNYVKNEKIPVVTPFANADDLYDYANLVLVETNIRVYTERIIREVKQVHTNQKIYIVGEKNDAEVVFLKNQLGNISKSVSVVNSATDITLEQNMATGQKSPAIIILANDNADVGRVFARKIVDFGNQTEGVRAFSIYYHNDFEKNIDGLSRASLVYLMDRKINVDGNFEKQVLRDFNNKYCQTPSKYTIIGFDVMNDMIDREINGNVMNQMEKVQTQLATKFEYVRAKKNGAYINTGYRVVRLIP